VISGRALEIFVQEIRSLSLASRATVNNLLLCEIFVSHVTLKMDAAHFSETSGVFSKDRTGSETLVNNLRE
jgi:hypothetical protein